MVGDARTPCVDVRAAELLRRHLLAGRRLHERWAADEDRPGAADDDRLVDIAGTYAPPAVQEPITTAICGIPCADIRAWLKKIRPKWSRSGNTSAWSGRYAPPESTR